ncbi:MAG: alanine racemase [Lachnospiraceae bacterium]|nr:alanine racemase [Lachnospiraceae bacterium]
MQYSEFESLPSPSYVFSADELTARFCHIREFFGEKIRLVYAMKANPFLTADLAPYADAFEVCSPGEMHICEKAGIPGEKLVLSGVNKDAADFAHAAEAFGDRPVYTVESPSQMEMLEKTAAACGLVFRVLLRVTDGNQFGMDEETVEGLIRQRADYPHLSVRGLQLFTGTQKKARQIERELIWIDAFIARLSENDGFDVEELEYGPGLPVEYFREASGKARADGLEDTGRISAASGAACEGPCGNVPVPGGGLLPSDHAVMAHLKEQLASLRFRGQISLELGRFAAAYCGYYLTRVADAKTSLGTNYLILDGGIHQLTYHGQTMAMKVPFILHKDPAAAGTSAGGAAPAIPYTLCGSLCTYADVLVRQVFLPKTRTGDLLVFTRAGAYAVTEGIALFLSRGLPRVYIKRGDVLHLIRDLIPTEVFNYG